MWKVLGAIVVVGSLAQSASAQKVQEDGGNEPARYA
jgi:hypothetical protein